MEVMEQGWERHHPFLALDPPALEARLRDPFPGARVVRAEPLAGGLRNSNYRVWLAGRPAPVVVRLYTADPAACRREVALAALVGSSVPVPAVLHADPEAEPPLTVTAWVEAVRLDALLRNGEPAGPAESAAGSAGEVLARIHRFSFPAAGFLGPDLEVRQPLDLSDAGWPAHMEHFLFRGRAGDRLGPDLTRRLWRLVGEQAPRLAPLRGARSLVHADYKPWNLLVAPRDRVPGKPWSLVAVLDWEFAFAGPPLDDLAIFLRHRATLPPGYAEAFLHGYAAAGGVLPPDWEAQARLLDLLNLCSMLDQPGGGSARTRDISALIRATVDGWS
jgi:Ser/Thr protein kinase RdoA (MazF antagonist)